MAITARKGTSYIPDIQSRMYNALRGTVATLAMKFHADVTSYGTQEINGISTSSPFTISLPNATSTATATALANALVVALVTHLSDTLAHSVANTAGVTSLKASSPAVDDPSTVTLAGIIQSVANAHGAAAGVHYTNDSSTPDSTTITTAATAWTSLNNIRTWFNTHIVSSPAGQALSLIAT